VIPEARDAMEQARRCLDTARLIADRPVPEVVGKLAYLAAYHAANALIASRRGKVARTHTGTRTVLAELAREDARISVEFRQFLAAAYEMKALSDYGRASRGPVAPEEAQDAIATAERMIAAIQGILEAP
jgi:uncharacterized protein (UPF0332 family)